MDEHLARRQSKLGLVKIVLSFECFSKDGSSLAHKKLRDGENSELSEFSPACC
jgi:hypothetical protein